MTEADAGDNFNEGQGVNAEAKEQGEEEYDDEDKEVDAMEEDDEVNEIISKIPLPPPTIPIGQVENDLVSCSVVQSVAQLYISLLGVNLGTSSLWQCGILWSVLYICARADRTKVSLAVRDQLWVAN